MGVVRACCFRRRCGAPRPPTYSGSSSSHMPRDQPWKMRAVAAAPGDGAAVAPRLRAAAAAPGEELEKQAVAAAALGEERPQKLYRRGGRDGLCGDPVWAISQSTISDLIGLSLNFFFILPLLNSAGVHLLESPVLHPMAEGLFNFVIAWTLMFAPLLFKDSRRDRYKGSLDVLWGFQMFLTNTFLIPYMAIRLNDPDEDQSPPQTSQLSSVMVRGASVVGITGGLVCILSIVWALFGRADADFGGTLERWQFAQSYVFSERLAYAFLWDILLYSIFQPWLIGDNLQNVKANSTEFVNVVRFLPVVGLVAYLLCLEETKY